MCNTKNKSFIIPPTSNQILCEYPKEIYIIDFTELPKEYITDDNKHIYLLSIIDHFSKYAYNNYNI